MKLHLFRDKAMILQNKSKKWQNYVILQEMWATMMREKKYVDLYCLGRGSLRPRYKIRNYERDKTIKPDIKR